MPYIPLITDEVRKRPGVNRVRFEVWVAALKHHAGQVRTPAVSINQLP
jgi:hypothetical protein